MGMKAVTMLAPNKQNLMREIQANIQERAKLALAIIIGNNCLNKKHTASQLMGKSTEGTPQEAADADANAAEDEFVKVNDVESKGFREVMHDVFMNTFSTSMMNDCGIQVIDMSIEDVVIVNTDLATAMASAAVANSKLEQTTIEAEIVQVKAAAEGKVALIEARGKAAAMAVLAQADADRIATVSHQLESACPSAQQLELVRASAAALGSGSTVLLEQDTGALATLLSGAQGASLGPKLAR